MRVKYTNVRELRVREAAGRRELHIEQKVVDATLPVCGFEPNAVVEQSELETTLSFRSNFRLEVRVPEVVRLQASTDWTGERSERRELRKRGGLTT